MKRTQIYLSDEQKDSLKKLSRQKSRPMAELVREAVENYIIENTKSELDRLKESEGIWSDRQDINDSAEYVNDMRKSWRNGKENST